ncbi:MAG: hypothetical protein C4290_05310 [Chloroflexota bacterium]
MSLVRLYELDAGPATWDRLDDAESTAEATNVKGTLLAAAALVLGALIVAVKLATDGPTPSFVLALGLLLIADGVLRLLTRWQDRAP